MANFVERRAFNLMGIFDGLGEYLNTGDPIVREWFLIKSNFWPIFLCSMYLLTIKVIGPSFMRDRKPFELRKTMMVYNLFLVAAYATCVSIVIYLMKDTDHMVLCKDTVVTRENSTYTIFLYTHHRQEALSHIMLPEYQEYDSTTRLDAVSEARGWGGWKMATCGWVIYLLKYIEFLDTIFFVLRKKDNLITNLHVIHHFTLPLCGWIFFRTERSGFQAYPIIINSIVHIVMYSYYGLAAMGPSVRKYLWWKRYLTIAQMIQFILIILFVTVVMPITGCTAAKTSVYINVTCAGLFFVLFYNFYQNSFKPTSPKVNGVSHKEEIAEKCSSHTNGDVANGVGSKVKCN